MNDDFDDELLSAYVDGELTADERATVEERLRADPHAAELVEELRTISRAVKALPRETLGRDLRASIQAELDETRADEQRHVLPLSEPLDPPRGFYRGFLWSTIAIAAALMIMFLQYRQQQDERDVAVAAKDEAGAVEEHTARNNRRDEALEDGALPRQGEMRSLEPPRAAAEPAAGGIGSLGATSGSAGDAENLPPAAPAATEGRHDASDALAAQTDKSETQLGRTPAEALRAVQTVELQMRSDDGVQRFARLLAENNFRLTAETAVAHDQNSTASRGSLQDYYGQPQVGQQWAGDSNASAVQVVVEGTPAQVEQLVDSYRQQPDVFAEVAAPESLTRRTHEFRREAALSAGAAGGKPPGQADSSVGVAWIVAPDDASKLALYFSGEEAKRKGIAAESNVQLGAPVQPLAQSDPAARAGAEVTSPAASQLSKQIQSPPPEGRVRMKFVLRPAPQPAAAAAPATAEP